MTKKILGTAALAFLLSAGVAGAQTSTTSTTTVGTPNTGLGGDRTATAVVLTGAAAIALLGAVALSRRELE